MNEVMLDDEATYAKYDPSGMGKRIRELPTVILDAWQAALAFELPDDYKSVDKILILGMGGSAIGGDLVRRLLLNESKAQITVLREYNLPAWVDERTLVIASSYSGGTEETLSAFNQALSTPAKKLVITTGGKLLDIARDNGVPAFVFKYDAQPRAAIAWGVFPLLNFITRLGLAPDKAAEVAEAALVTEQFARKIEPSKALPVNQAKEMAYNFYGRIPVIYGSDLAAEVAYRWRTQLNENSKHWAFAQALPELNHNAVVGYEFPADLISKMQVVMLRSNHQLDRNIKRYQITGELLARAGARVTFTEGRGIAPIAQMMTLILMGDYTSYYLAMLNQVDPTPVEVISYLKGRLAESN
ncbi:glucose/mannose-6-phosphate isomerase [Dehalogenimonas formicexedens]|uniref:Glucose/mannose-6-phosphate isomerase n=1 Tax=Dehalogenimonas formicexedens TaxID=1839801 RepID=A0A1P8F580_9CHLR|nr:bifunctional phosphoglucose/phosphomannose isomerase [Dehalogenimonas formicexedens]APV43590.1 glucose/mannose-6-phosphate isomerase [Dehalogenimonas formicexedens]